MQTGDASGLAADAMPTGAAAVGGGVPGGEASRVTQLVFEEEEGVSVLGAAL